MIKAENIIKCYDGETIVNGFSIRVEKGGMALLIGPSGGGKSTIIRLLSLLESPDSGVLRFNDLQWNFPTRKKEKVSIWPQVTVVFQQLHLWPHLKLIENIKLPIKKKGVDDKKLTELLEYFNVDHIANKYPNEASQGQRQRIAFIRAVMLEPKYVLLDEVTSALDIEQTRNLFEYVIKMQKEGVGFIIATHHLEFIELLLKQDSCNNFYFIENGTVIEKGNLVEFSNPKSERLRSFFGIV